LRLVAGGAIGGGLVGGASSVVAHWTLLIVFGLNVTVGGALAGLAIGGATGLGYAITTGRLREPLAAPRGRTRVGVALVTAVSAAVAALALAAAGWALVGGTVHAIAQASAGSQAALTPLAHLVGEPEFGPVTRALIGMAEGGLFGLGLALGLTHRPAWAPARHSSRTSHEVLTEG
jgi:hypothetical protein